MKQNMELFQRLRSRFKEKTFITWSYALKELWIIDREVDDLDIAINYDIYEIEWYLSWLDWQVDFDFEIDSDIQDYWQWYIKVIMSDKSKLDILYCPDISLENGFIHPRTIKEYKEWLIVMYKDTIIVEPDTKEKEKMQKKIEKHKEDIIRIDQYLKLF